MVVKKTTIEKGKSKKKIDYDGKMTVVSVTASCGMTINRGNFESMRFDASVTINSSEKGQLTELQKDKLTDIMFDKAWDLSGIQVYNQLKASGYNKKKKKK